MKSLLTASTLGIEIAVAVFLGAFIGYQIDIRSGSKPVGMVIGVLLGGAVGMWNAVRAAIREK